MATKIKKQTAPKTTAAKKPAKKPSAASLEWGDRLTRAFALYTGASIVSRKNGEITLELPFTVVVGKKETPSSAKVVFEPADFGLLPKGGAEKLPDLEIGKRMFAMFCDHTRVNGSIGDKELSKCKRFAIQTLYGDKYVWNGTTGEVVDAAPKPKEKRSRPKVTAVK